jgi:hypothetical protein
LDRMTTQNNSVTNSLIALQSSAIKDTAQAMGDLRSEQDKIADFDVRLKNLNNQYQTLFELADDPKQKQTVRELVDILSKSDKATAGIDLLNSMKVTQDDFRRQLDNQERYNKELTAYLNHANEQFNKLQKQVVQVFELARKDHPPVPGLQLGTGFGGFDIDDSNK